MLFFYPFSCPLHRMVYHDLGGRTKGWRFNFNWGWRSKIYLGCRLNTPEVDGLKFLEVDDSPRGHEQQTFVVRLSSINEAFHMSHFDWILYRIKASLHLPCILGIYNTLFHPHFYFLQPKHIVRVPPSTLLEHSIVHPYPSTIQPSTFSYFREQWVLLLLFKSCICAYI